MKYLQESGLRVPLSSQVSPPSQSALEARGEALLRPGGGRGGPGLGGHGGVQAEDGGVRGAGGEEEEAAPPLDVAPCGGETGEDEVNICYGLWLYIYPRDILICETV